MFFLVFVLAQVAAPPAPAPRPPKEPELGESYLAVTIAAGPTLVAQRLTGNDELGRGFEYEVRVRPAKAVTDPGLWLGRHVTVTVHPEIGGMHHIDGYVTELTTVDGQWRIKLGPFTDLLRNVAGFEVFRDASVPELVGRILKRHGFARYESKLGSRYPSLPVVTQYKESDTNFLSRMLEDAGIYTYFRHQLGSHTLVLADAGSSHPPPRVLRWRAPTVTFPSGEREEISDWSRTRRFTASAYRLSDRDTKGALVSATAALKLPAGVPALEVFDHPGGFTTSAEAARTARLRLEEFRADADVVRGNTNAPWLQPGATFTLRGHPIKRDNDTYLVTRTERDIDADEDVGVARTDFTAVPLSTPFRPARNTPMPVADGVELGEVVPGPIRVDAVEVRLSWQGPTSRGSTTVARVLPGLRPRTGDRVVLEFEDGVLSRPIIVGVLPGEAAAAVR